MTDAMILFLLWKLNIWKNSGSQVIGQNVLSNQIAIFFNHQYL